MSPIRLFILGCIGKRPLFYSTVPGAPPVPGMVVPVVVPPVVVPPVVVPPVVVPPVVVPPVVVPPVVVPPVVVPPVVVPPVVVPPVVVPPVVVPPVVVPVANVISVNGSFLYNVGFTYSFLASKPNPFFSINSLLFSKPFCKGQIVILLLLSLFPKLLPPTSQIVGEEGNTFPPLPLVPYCTQM